MKSLVRLTASLAATMALFFSLTSVAESAGKISCRHDARPSDGDLQEVTLTQTGTVYELDYHVAHGGLVPQPIPDENVRLDNLTCQFANSNRAIFSCDTRAGDVVLGAYSQETITTSVGPNGKDDVEDRIQIRVTPLTKGKNFDFDTKDCGVTL